MDDLLKACGVWSHQWFLIEDTEQDLRPFIENGSFQTIVNYEQTGDGVVNIVEFLLELIYQSHVEFLMPYAFLTRTIPEGFEGVSMGLIGDSSDMLVLINQLF